MAYWPWRHRKHPLSAQEEVSVIASVCLFFYFKGASKTQLKGLQFAWYTWAFWSSEGAQSVWAQSSNYTLYQPTWRCDSYILIPGCGFTRAFQPLVDKWQNDSPNPVIPQYQEPIEQSLYQQHHFEHLIKYSCLLCLLFSAADKWQQWDLSVLGLNSHLKQTAEAVEWLFLLSSDSFSVRGWF